MVRVTKYRKSAAPNKRVETDEAKALTPLRRKMFSEAYIANGGNGTQAAITAGFSPEYALVASLRMLKLGKPPPPTANRVSFGRTNPISTIPQSRDFGSIICFKSWAWVLCPPSRKTLPPLIKPDGARAVFWTGLKGKDVVVYGEDSKNFDALLADVIANLKPSDVVERLGAEDFVYLHWEVLRYPLSVQWRN